MIIKFHNLICLVSWNGLARKLSCKPVSHLAHFSSFLEIGCFTDVCYYRFPAKGKVAREQGDSETNPIYSKVRLRRGKKKNHLSSNVCQLSSINSFNAGLRMDQSLSTERHFHVSIHSAHIFKLIL